MFRSRRRYPVVAWIACLALLANTLVPSIAHAMAARGWPSAVAELCSASGGGGRIVIRTPPGRAAGPSADARTDGPAHRSAPTAGHCPACLGSPEPAVSAPAQAGTFLVATPTRPLPAFAPRLVAPRAAWTPSNPRAPPARG
ncbi:MAG: DUF2946 domain-containing protein [Burkholderiales bacterium]|nr:MAG: DUF2946 domain-containing protein [Burkholderiales bacterium]